MSDKLVMECVYPGTISTARMSEPETVYSSTGNGLPSASSPTFLSLMLAVPETTRNLSHLLMCQWLPLVMPGLETLIETWPRSGVRRNSVNEPRASVLGFRP